MPRSGAEEQVVALSPQAANASAGKSQAMRFMSPLIDMRCETVHGREAAPCQPQVDTAMTRSG